MTLKEKINENFRRSLKEKATLETSVLRMLWAAILNKEKEKRAKIAKDKKDMSEKDLEKESQLSDEESTEVVSSEAKKRKEAITGFQKGERPDLVEKEKKELEILQKYLPEQLSEEKIQKLAKEAIGKVGATGSQDMGKIMAELMPKVKGKADGTVVSRIVKELLV